MIPEARSWKAGTARAAPVEEGRWSLRGEENFGAKKKESKERGGKEGREVEGATFSSFFS